MKKIILLLILFICGCSEKEATFSYFTGTLEQAKQKAEQENKLILLNLTSGRW